jgi:anaerobic ribonucleoside-triphosphate reductase activating protein
MLLHAFLPASRANGPGLRAVVFFQGCVLHCPGCWNPETHAIRGNDVAVSEVVERVVEAHRREPLEGVTFSGGEPMHQAADLAELMAQIRRADAGMGFGMFTGYGESELEAGACFVRGVAAAERKAKLWQSVRAFLDFAVMGRYDRELPSTAPLRTSRNQRLVLFTGRYRESNFEQQLIEVNIAAGGATVVAGFPVRGIPA